MKKPGALLIIVGVVILLGAILYVPTMDLINRNIGGLTGDNEVEAELEDGAVYAEGELVSDFPEVPVYPNATLKKSIEVNSNGSYGYIATWVTNTRSVADVLRFYVNEAKKRNWTIVRNPDLSGRLGEDFIEARAHNRKLIIVVERETDESNVEVRFDFPPEGE